MADEEIASGDNPPEESLLDGSEFGDYLAPPEMGQSLKREGSGRTLPQIGASSSRAEKSSALGQALRMLADRDSKAALSDEDLESYRSFFCGLYAKGSYRHEYSSLSALMYKLLGEGEGHEVDLVDDLPYELNALADNMTTVRTHLEDLAARGDAGSSPLVTADVLQSVQKLDDHVELELTRMRYQVKQNAVLHKNVERLTGDFKRRVDSAQDDLYKNMEGMSSEFSEDIRKAEERSQRNYVSALGIFISLVISFSAAIRLSSEAIEALSTMSTYRFLATLVAVVCGILILVLTLLYFVLVVSGIEGGPRKAVGRAAIAGVVVFAILSVTVVAARLLSWFG